MTDKLLKVPKAVVDARLKQYREEREQIPRALRPGPNPKRKRAGRASKG